MITNIRFYAGIICMTLLILFFSKNDVFAFRWLPSLSVSTSIKQVDTTYIIQKKISESAILLTYANISIWHNWWSVPWWSLQDLNGDTINKALTSIKNLQIIRTTDVLKIKNSWFGTDWLNVFLQQWETSLLESQNIATELQNSIDVEQSQVDLCTSQKSQSDELYRQWLSSNNANQIEQATQQAQEASSCISTHWVTIKSFNWVLINLNTEIEKTKKYITLVTTNKWLISQYNDLLVWEIPSQLVQLQKEFNAL